MSPVIFWDSHVSGNTITKENVDVRYLPTDPNRSFLVGTAGPAKEMEYVFYGVPGAGLILLLVGIKMR